MFYIYYYITMIKAEEIMECPLEEEMDFVEDAVEWLAEDVLDHEDRLDALENGTKRILSKMTDVIEKLTTATATLVDVMDDHEERIAKTDKTLLITTIVFRIWNIVLTAALFF